MPTSLDRILLRWLPLALVLAAAFAVATMLGPHRFTYHDWPKPPVHPPVERVVGD